MRASPLLATAPIKEMRSSRSGTKKAMRAVKRFTIISRIKMFAVVKLRAIR